MKKSRQKKSGKETPAFPAARFEDWSQHPEPIFVDEAKGKTSFSPDLAEKAKSHVDAVLTDLEKRAGLENLFNREQITHFMVPLFLGLPPDRKQIKRELRKYERQKKKIISLLKEKDLPGFSRDERYLWGERWDEVHLRTYFWRGRREQANKRCRTLREVVTNLMDFFWITLPLRERIALKPHQINPTRLYGYIGEMVEGLPSPCAGCGQHHRFASTNAVRALDKRKGHWEGRGQEIGLEIEANRQRLAELPHFRVADPEK